MVWSVGFSIPLWSRSDEYDYLLFLYTKIFKKREVELLDTKTKRPENLTLDLDIIHSKYLWSVFVIEIEEEYLCFSLVKYPRNKDSYIELTINFRNVTKIISVFMYQKYVFFVMSLISVLF